MTPTCPAHLADPIAALRGHTDHLIALTFSPDRCLLATAARDGTGRLWDVAHSKPRERGVLQKQIEGFRSLAFSPNGRRLAAGSASLNGLVWVFDVTDKQPLEQAVLRGAKGAIEALAFSPDSKLLAGGGEDRTLRIWEPVPGGTGAARSQLVGHSGPITGVTFAPDGQTVATASTDSTVRLWSLGRIRSTERAALPHDGPVSALAFSADGKNLATASNGILRLWDLTGLTPRQLIQFPAQAAAVRAVVIAPDALVAASDDRRVTGWDVRTGTAKREWQLSGQIGTALALTPDGRYLAAGTADSTIHIYRVAEKRTGNG